MLGDSLVTTVAPPGRDVLVGGGTLGCDIDREKEEDGCGKGTGTIEELVYNGTLVIGKDNDGCWEAGWSAFLGVLMACITIIIITSQ